MPKPSAGDIVKYAIRHAVDERSSYLDAISHCFEPHWEEERKEARDWIKAMKAYYVRRFGHDPWEEERKFYENMKVLRLKANGELVDSDEDKT